MTSLDIETDSTKEYLIRLEDRVQKGASVAKRLVQIQEIVKSAERHFQRLELPRKRYIRAMMLGDHLSAAYEKRVLETLMYEIMDTSYIVMQLLDFNHLNLDSSADCQGLTGDSAATVVSVLKTLDRQCAEVFTLEEDFELRIDFAYALDEKEGITFTKHPHWQDLIPGSLERSFHEYFSGAQSRILERLEQRPEFWEAQTKKQYFAKNYRSLLKALNRLLHAHFHKYE